MFRRAAQRGRLSHAYLFVGPDGIGKRLVARGIAQCLFCDRFPDEELNACCECPSCRQVLAGTHPDLLTVACPEGKRELPIELMVGDRDNRGQEGLCYEFSRSPMLAQRRIAIIDDAHTFNPESGNALLKTLEEPPPGGMLFLITPNIGSILPTIRSRCQPVYFSPLSDADVAELLCELEITESIEEARRVAALSGGSLSLAKRLLEPGLSQLHELVEQLAANRSTLGIKSAERLVHDIDELASGPAQRELARLAIGFLAEAWSPHEEEDRASEEALELRARLLDRCAVAEQHLDSAMPVPLCLEALMLECGGMARGSA
jgi:DNA polymerase-3 subunit delta'